LNNPQSWNFRLGVGQHNAAGTYMKRPHKIILSVRTYCL